MQRALDACAVVVAKLPDVIGDVVQVRTRNWMVGEQHLASRHASFRLTAEVEHDLEQLTRIGAFVQGAGQVGGQRAGKKLYLLVPPPALHAPGRAAYTLDWLGGHPNEGTSPFSRTGTRTASSLTRSSCVSSMLNPRPRRASIMWES